MSLVVTIQVSRSHSLQYAPRGSPEKMEYKHAKEINGEVFFEHLTEQMVQKKKMLFSWGDRKEVSRMKSCQCKSCSSSKMAWSTLIYMSYNAQKISALLSYVQVTSEALSIHSTLDVFIWSFMWQKQTSRSMAKAPKSATTQKARLQRAQNLWVRHQWWFQWEDASAKVHTTNIAPEFTEIFLGKDGRTTRLETLRSFWGKWMENVWRMHGL